MQKVLVANRGESAVRVIRAVHQLGLPAVAVYSTADKGALHTRMADEAYCIGGPSPRESYLDIPRILEAVKMARADAVHPGFGMLSENVEFVRALEDMDILFAGPPSSVIAAMGDKAQARSTLEKQGIPTLPGSDGPVESAAQAAAVADEIGYPVLLKAVAGGGGRGIRMVENSGEMPGIFEIASAEASASFGDGRLYVEKYLREPRHVEVQVLSDAHGNHLHFLTRDCSAQRRSQKIIEEAPAACVQEKTQRKLCRLAVKAAQSVGYVNAGTVEFLVDEDENVYFMEMNTRIQVEHPITEMITGVDLVQAQLRIAAGEELMLPQKDIIGMGHAIECRINAEDPRAGFSPSPGVVKVLHLPGGPGVRVDAAVTQGDTVSPRYDSMLMKIIAHDASRPGALRRMAQALSELRIEGVTTNLDFLRYTLHHMDFNRNRLHTRWIEQTVLPEYLEDTHA
jgi:acetyl-CoA carboxylase biotin carboxylase subunit